MILLWGLSGDAPFERVRAALERRDAAFTVVDQRSVLDTGVDLAYDGRLTSQIEVRGEVMSLDDVSGVYWRPYDVRRVPAVQEADLADDFGSAQQAAWSVEEAFAVWLELTAACVVNRPSSMTSNGSKPFQLAILREHGFDVPKTLVTTNREAVLRFWTDHGAVIYKSMSGARSIVARLSESHIARLGQLVWCPTQFQQYVPGRDYRVHVIGDEVYTSEIRSEADDYRYAGVAGLAGEPAEVVTGHVPDDVAERCVAVSRAMGLHLSGIDLRRAPDGRWFCFEVNPSPGFSYYESHTGQPLADAIARLLIAGPLLESGGADDSRAATAVTARGGR